MAITPMANPRRVRGYASVTAAVALANIIPLPIPCITRKTHEQSVGVDEDDGRGAHERDREPRDEDQPPAGRVGYPSERHQDDRGCQDVAEGDPTQGHRSEIELVLDLRQGDVDGGGQERGEHVGHGHDQEDVGRLDRTPLPGC